MSVDSQKKFYITTPIFYPNANLHMGHAYSTTVSDIIARYERLNFGKEGVYFLTGADENTEKVVRAAKAVGKETREYLDGIVANFKSLFSDLEISYDQFIRTSDEKVHWPGAVELWKRIAAAGDLEKRTYEGLYCVGHEAFITEKDLVNGKCPDHNETPQTLKEENYFFKLSKYTQRIKEEIESGQFNIIPHTRKNEILAQLERGLEDISFSRPAEKVSMGIPVPGDETQKMYVWCDALANYISALGFGTADDFLYKKFWPADVHVIGKDILRFHAAIWPGMLLSARLPLPKKLFVHGFITSGGKKMSKSLGNVIDPVELIRKYGAEAVRYFLARHITPFEDGDITLQSFKDVYNANLANGLGNLVSRTLTMANKNGVELLEKREELDPKFVEAMEKFEINKAADIVWQKISEADEYVQKNEPFKKIKTDETGAKKDIAHLLFLLHEIAFHLQPILPQTAGTILDLVSSSKIPTAPLFPRKE